MTNEKPQVGKRYRIVETYPSGTTVTYEGVVCAILADLADFERGEARVMDDLRAYWRDTAGVTVTVEKLADPLPTTRGSVVRVRVGLPSALTLVADGSGSWRTPNASVWSDEDVRAEDGGYEVIFVAPQPS